MEKIVLNLPAMYGDHHVIEVRRILLDLPGVTNVFASSAFRSAEISFDPAVCSADLIRSTLDAASYLGELPSQGEVSRAASDINGGAVSMRHTKVYEQTKQYISFTQDVVAQGRPLWPCPGMGPVRGIDD